MVEERGEPSPSSFALRLAVRVPAPGTRFPGPVPGACFAGPRSPRPPPFAPPAPPPVARPCSPASSLLWRGLTSRVRASSATAPRLPDADRRRRRRRPSARSPGSRARSVRTCQGLRPRRAGRALALTRPSVLPSAYRNSVGTRDYRPFAAQWLACALPCRRFAAALTGTDARLGADVVRYSFIVEDLHLLLLAGLPAHYRWRSRPRRGGRVCCGGSTLAGGPPCRSSPARSSPCPRRRRASPKPPSARATLSSKLRDELGAIFADADFADLFPRLGQPGLPPWRLALVTILQFRENLPDRRAAEAVRARIDWKYLLGLELDRSRLRPLGPVRVPRPPGRGRRRGAPARQAARGVPGARPAQGARPAAHRLDPRAGLDPRAQPARAGRRDPARGPERAGHRRPGLAARSGPEGLVQALRPPDRGRPPAAGRRPSARPTRAPSARTGSRCSTGSTSRRRPRSCAGCRRSRSCGGSGNATSCARTGRPRAAACARRPRTSRRRAAEPVESPYDPQARYRTRSGTSWIGYIVHLSETCEDDAVHLITHAMTTVAAVHEARCTAAIHEALAGKGLVPGEHLVDAAYVDAELLVREPRGARHRPARPAAAEPELADQARGRLHASTGSRSTGSASGCAARRASCPRPGARRSTAPARPYIPVQFRQGRLRRLPGAAPVHAGRARPGTSGCTRGQSTRRSRRARGRLATKEGRRRLRPAGRDRGHHLAGRARLRAAPQPLSRAGQDPPAARRDRGRDQPRASRRLVPGDPARRHPHLALRRPAAA